MNKVLLAITTYNQSDYTKLFFSQFTCSENVDVIVIDDHSTDDTVQWCQQHGINVIEKASGYGLTHSWNLAYRYFKSHEEYEHLIISNNDVIIPLHALDELISCHTKWPSLCIVPLTNPMGCGHNELQDISRYYTDLHCTADNAREIQDNIILYRNSYEMRNRRFLFDPIRMLMFNGFCFSLKRKILNYERTDGLLFNPDLLNFKNEDDFNWSVLIPNDEYPMLCKTSYIYHFKGVSFKDMQNARDNNLNLFLKNR
jgi:GT2 family glycosyltransferase